MMRKSYIEPCSLIYNGQHLASVQLTPSPHVVQDGADKAQQASLLKQCLACWGAGLTAHREEDAADSQDAIEKLVAFVEQGEGPTGSQIIDIAQVQPDELRCSCQMTPSPVQELHCRRCRN